VLCLIPSLLKLCPNDFFHTWNGPPGFLDCSVVSIPTVAMLSANRLISF
jgi:hypothetical protein